MPWGWECSGTCLWRSSSSTCVPYETKSDSFHAELLTAAIGHPSLSSPLLVFAHHGPH